MVAIEWRRSPVGELLPIAIRHDHFRRALHEQHLLPIGALVQRGHELVLGLERDRADARVGFLLVLALHAELVGERIQRAFGGITLHLPHALRLEQLGVVAEQRVAAEQLEQQVFCGGLPALLDIAVGRIAVAADLVLGLGRRRRHDHHFHQREGSGLV